MWEVGDANLPDHPDTQRLEKYGTLNPEEEEKEVVCPICGKIAERFFFDCDGTLFGCDVCVSQKSADEYEPE